MPDPTQQYCNKGTVILPANREINRFSKGGSSANQLDIKAQKFNVLCKVTSPPSSQLPALTFRDKSGMGGSKSRLRTELYFQAAVVHDPREGALSAAVLYTLLWEKTNI